MKKSIEKLFKNEIFKKVTMGMMFALVCSFACFLNWKAVVGAEGEGGGEPAQPQTTFTLHFNEPYYCDAVDEQGAVANARVGRLECQIGDGAVTTLYDSTQEGAQEVTSCQVPYDSTKSLALKMIPIGQSNLNFICQDDHWSCDYSGWAPERNFKMTPDEVQQYVREGGTYRLVNEKNIGKVSLAPLWALVSPQKQNSHGDDIPQIRMYDYLDIKYKTQTDGEYRGWRVVEQKIGETEEYVYTYKALDLVKGDLIKIKIEGKNGLDAGCLEYAYAGKDFDWSRVNELYDDQGEYFNPWFSSDNPYLNDSTQSNVVIGENATILFRGFADVLKVHDNSSDNLYDKLEIEYKYGEIQTHDEQFKAFPTNGTGENISYAPMRIGQQNSKITLSVKPKSGYDITNVKYFLNHIYSVNADSPGWPIIHEYTAVQDPNVAENWKKGTETADGWTIIHLEVGANPTVTFKDFSYTKLKLYFRGPDGQELGSNIATVSLGTETKITEYEVNGVSSTSFLVKLGEDCESTELSESNFALINPVQSGSVSLSGTWNEGTNEFTLKVDARTFDSEVEIQLINVNTKEVSFTFKMESGFEYPLSVGVPENASYSPQNLSYTELDGSPKTLENGKVIVGSDFVFYLKAEDYAHWVEVGTGSIDNPQAGTEILNLLSFGQGSVKRISCEHIDAYNIYKITLEDVHCASDDTTVPITFKKDLTDVHDINISFSGVKFPEDVNTEGNKKIEVKQGTTEYSYPGRDAAYTVKATIKPKRSEITEDTVITLYNTEGDFEFKDNKFRFGDQEFNGVVYGNNTICSFSIANVSGALNALRSGDLNIECLGLQPNDKTVNVTSVGFKDITVNDENDVSYPISEGKCQVPYGSILTIGATISEGYTINVAEEQFKAYIIAPDSSHIDMTSWEITERSDSFFKVSFGKPLSGDLGVEFIADNNNIPISFKAAEGIDYYYTNMRIVTVTDPETHEPKEVNELITDNPLTKEGGQKKPLKGIEKVNLGNNYYFAVGVKPGYDINKLTIKSNGKSIDAYVPEGYEDYVVEGCKFYKLEEVKASITVSASVEKGTVKVKFNNTSMVPQDAGIKYMSDNTEVTNKDVNATYGNSVTFTVSVGDKYSQSDFKVHVKSKNDPSYPTGDENTLTKYQGEYKILDITEDKEVYITGITVNKYVVNFVANNRAGYLLDGKSFQGVREVTHGSDIDFRIAAKEGYKLGNETVVNCQSASGEYEVNRKKNSADAYKLNAITENCTITIDHVDNITYKVTFKDVPGATYLNDKGSVVSGGTRVKYGGNFEFSVNVDDAYDDSAAGMFIILNGGKSKLHAQKLASGRYMVSNITEDVTVKVGNIRKNTYTVTLRNEEGIDYYNSSDKIITGDNTVNHGDSFSFRVSLYPAYSDSEISVMLGNDKLSADSSGYYTISGIIEDKMVTVTGIHPNSEVGLVNAINNLPSSVNDLNDVNPVIEASRWYNSLPDDKKAAVTNADVLMNLQQQAGVLLHNSDGVTIDGADWYIKLVVVPISSDMDACTRIYKKLTSEYILSLYDIYLWDTLNDVKYTSYGDKVYTVTIPAPRLTNFRNPTGVHEDSNSGKVSFMDLMFNGDKVSFETNSFSAMGVVASHDASGVSSLLDTPGANIPWIRDYVFGGARSGSSDNGSSGNTLINDDGDSAGDDTQDIGNINDKFRSINNRVTPQGSALRLILVLLILLLLALALWFIYKKHKEREE